MQNKLAKCLNLSNEKDLCFNCNRMGKIIEIVTKENISPLKAQYQLSKHEAFDDLMLFHRKTPQQIKHFKSSQDRLKAFYYKHVERWLKDFKSRSYLKKYPTIKTYLKKSRLNKTK